jgi:alpha-D-xyloside xylohydrolase
MEQMLFFRDKKNKVLVELYAEGICRVRQTQLAAFKDYDDAIVMQKELIAEFEREENSIASSLIKVCFDERGYLEFYRKGEAEPRIMEHKSPRALHEGGRNLKALQGDLFRAECYFKAYDCEKIWGGGQHQYNAFDQKGLSLPLHQMNSQVSVPFYISSRGYGLFWNNPGVGHVEFCRNWTRFVMEATHQIDYFVIIGNSPSEILSSYYKLTGKPSELPFWATGFWQCKLRYENQNELLTIAREYQKRELPLSVIVIDYFHWTKQGTWDFDKACWPDPQAMVAELKDKNVQTVVSVWPTVNPDSPHFPHMEKQGYLIETERGTSALMRFTDTYENGISYQHYYDATNPEAGKYVWNIIEENYLKNGIQAFWLDACEPEVIPYDYDNLRFHRGNGSAVSSIYPLLHEKTFYTQMKANGVESPLNLCRSAWCGSQRYGVLVWSGDIDSSFESLETQMKAGLNMVTSGIPWWTTDIGGFYGGNIDSPVFRELIVRWFQFGVFCPVFRLHGLRDSWNPKKGADNEVWSFGDEAYEIIKKLLNFREALRPYIQREAKKTSDGGKPIMRPLLFDFYEDEHAISVEDQFMFGDDILVAPIVKQSQREREVYLPKGIVWINPYSKELHEGGVSIQVKAPLASIPVFIKNTSDLIDCFSILK